MSDRTPNSAYVYQPEAASHPTPFAVAGPGTTEASRSRRYATRSEAESAAEAINGATGSCRHSQRIVHGVDIDTPRSPLLKAMITPGRNEPCPCGSGRKYKRCCGAPPQLQPPNSSATTDAPLLAGME